jgi:outer membrane protein
MKNLNTILLVILMVAVGVLYYLHFNTTPNKADAKPVAKTTEQVSNNDVQIPLIAFVELDSLNENITYIKNKRKELEAEQRSIEIEWENGYKDLERQRDNFLKKGNAITQEEAQQMQISLMSQQEKIDQRKQTKIQRLSERSYTAMEGIQEELKKFVDEYNSDKRYMYILTTGTGLDYLLYKDSTLNITDDVIKGMNEKLDKKKD